MAKNRWTIQGSAASPYEILHNDDDHMSCNCSAWTTGWKRNEGSRICKHVRKVVADDGLKIVQRGDYWYVAGLLGKAQSTTKLSGKNKSWLDKAVLKAAKAEPEPLIQTHKVASPFIEPMLASKMPSGKTVASYDAEHYVMEEKYDGHRIVVRVDADGAVRAWSRLGNIRALPGQCPAEGDEYGEGILGALSEIGVAIEGAVLDGELIVPAGKSYAVTDGANTGKETFVIFDLIEAMGKRVGYNQQDRRRMLQTAYEAVPEELRKYVVLSRQMAPSLAAVQEIWARGGEGAIIKALDTMYQPNVRTPKWIKVKKEESAVITITGWEQGLSGPFSVAVGKDASGTVIKVKTLNSEELQQAALQYGKTGVPPFIGRRLVVTMQERTPDGKARHAMWERWAGEQET